MRLFVITLAILCCSRIALSNVWTDQAVTADLTSDVYGAEFIDDMSLQIVPTGDQAGRLTIQVSNDPVGPLRVTNWTNLSGYNSSFINTTTSVLWEDSDVSTRWMRFVWDSYYFDNTHTINLDGTSAEWAQVSSPTDNLNVSNSRFVDGEYSVSIWVYNVTTTETYVSKGYDTALEWELYSNGGKYYWLMEYGAGGQTYAATAASTVATGEWVHLVGTYDATQAGTGMRVYINGTEAEYSTISSGGTRDYVKRSGALYLGTTNNSASASYCECYLSNLAIFDKELTAAEVRQLYNGGKPFDVGQWSEMDDYLLDYWKLGTGDTHPTYSSNSGNNDFTAESGVESGDISTTQVPSDADGTITVNFHRKNRR